MKKVYVYKVFERFWHWTQAALIFFLVITGFEIHSSYELFGYYNAVKWHNAAGWAFLVLIIFAIFWHFTTGEWRQYIPTTRFLKEQFNYYLAGIFKGAPHPTKKLVYNKFNPIQRIVYLGLKILVIPVQVITGFLYLYFNYPLQGIELHSLEAVATVHTLGAFMLVAFVIAHVYLTTTGHRPLSSFKAMISGWEEMEEQEVKERLTNEMEVALLKTRAQFRAGDDKGDLLDDALVAAGEKVGARRSQRDTRFRDSIFSSGAGYFCISKDGIYRDVNDTWVKLYKYDSKEEIIGKHYRLSRTEEDFKELEQTVEKVLKGATINHGEVRRICKDGSEGFHTLTLSPVMINNEITGFEGFIIDTTDKRMAEKELLKKQLRDDEELKLASNKKQ